MRRRRESRRGPVPTRGTGLVLMTYVLWGLMLAVLVCTGYFLKAGMGARLDASSGRSLALLLLPLSVGLPWLNPRYWLHAIGPLLTIFMGLLATLPIAAMFGGNSPWVLFEQILIGTAVWFPLPLGVGLLMCSLALRFHRFRASPPVAGVCPKCGYSTTGLKLPICSECGAVLDPATMHSPRAPAAPRDADQK